jgi:branched-chain amino acid transport system ATP-binding protein
VPEVAGSETILQVHDLSRHFGGLKAVDGVSFHVKKGEILGLIGPNGAGKTTCFNVISGVYKPTAGSIYLDGEQIDGLPAHEIAAKGIGRTFQIVRPFSGMTARRNVLVGIGMPRYTSFVRSWPVFNTEKNRERAAGFLRDVGIENLAETSSATLSLGNLRRLEIARALALEPKLLLLDESFSGLSQEEIGKMMKLVETIRDRGISVLLIEHNMRVAMTLCRRLVVLDHGQKLAEGPPEEIRSDERVIEAYLGKGASGNA